MEGPFMEQQASNTVFVFAVSFFFHSPRIGVANNELRLVFYKLFFMYSFNYLNISLYSFSIFFTSFEIVTQKIMIWILWNWSWFSNTFKPHTIIVQVLYLFVKRLFKPFICSPVEKYLKSFWSGKKNCQ